MILVIATGRAYVQIPRFEGIEFDSFLPFNGSFCFNQKENILSNPLKREDVLQIIENAKKIDKALGLSSKSSYKVDYLDKDLEKYFSFGSAMPDVGENIEKFAQNYDTYQMVMPIMKKYYDKVLSGTNSTKITAWWDRAVDIIPKNDGKGQEVGKFYHIMIFLNMRP